ncbi:translation initiation factor IF-2 N-terminal domain-containing protein [Corynebacterium sp. MSK105]|uniref:translation initiation factor IF-2 N-terminal domain-containing protein n=1 Tax=unclassified Corynebacterium TaxID=2624378 RepID=UPI002551730B|nr:MULTISPECIES: translation initiation factor IF-2 N-terminal domain-containing protein [unclassified Corynebacterium]MDK8482350.1 translation initiation factor IF-2 N-terminal domain-containing protein [Corynebacterium sp. MSK074]MDK8689789.1 translation initiation factor IF-2 N-terminal domain-containing protein [Corynebacterium sp. MSK105]
MVAQNSQETTESLKAAASLAQNLDRGQLKDKTRVYSLAKQLGLSSRELVAQLKDMGLKKSAQSSLSREEAGQVLDAVANAAAVADAPASDTTEVPAEEPEDKAVAQSKENADEEKEKKPAKKRAKRARKATRKSAAVAPEELADAAESGEGEQSAEDEEHLRHRVRKNVDNEISQIEDKVEASLAQAAAETGAAAEDAEHAEAAHPEAAEPTDGADEAPASALDTGTVDAAKLHEVLAEAGEDFEDDYYAPHIVPRAESEEDSGHYDFAPIFMAPQQDEAVAFAPAVDAEEEDFSADDSARDDNEDAADSADESREHSGSGRGSGKSEGRRRGRRGASRGRGAGAKREEQAHEPEHIEEPKAIRGSTRIEAQKRRRAELREKGRTRQHIVSQAEFLARREAVERTMVVRDKEREDGAGIITQVGVLEDDLLVEHFVTTESQASLIGNIYLGRVQNVLPSMEAAFVDIGQGRNGVLYAGEIDWRKTKLHGRARKVENALKSGDQVLVQVAKDPIGHKGARLTTQISLAGRYLVYVPGGRSAGISRKLPAPERKRLKDILGRVVPGDGGAIIRTAAENVPEEAIATDVNRLHSRWEDIVAHAKKEKSSKGAKPVTMYEEPNMLIKVVRDLFNEDFTELIVDGKRSFNTVRAYVDSMAPDLADRVVRYRAKDHGGQDAFEAYRIDEQLHKALSRKVWLPSGGTLVIDRTEAMTVIDVNTGKFTGSGGNLEETVTRNNLEAAEEIVRQMRLRDLGGMIVVDFIDMVLPENQDLVLRRLKEALGRDRTRHQVSEVTSLGLVQMTRKRLGTGLVETFSTECECCNGRGIIIHQYPVDEAEDDQRSKHSGRKSKGHKKHHHDPQQHPAAVAMHKHELDDAPESSSKPKRFKKTQAPVYGTESEEAARESAKTSLEDLVANVVVDERGPAQSHAGSEEQSGDHDRNKDRGRGRGRRRARKRTQTEVSDIEAIAYAAADNAAESDEVQEFNSYVPDADTDADSGAVAQAHPGAGAGSKRGKKPRRATRRSKATHTAAGGEQKAPEKEVAPEKATGKTYAEAVAEFEASPRRKRRTRGNSRSDRRPQPQDFAVSGEQDSADADGNASGAKDQHGQKTSREERKGRGRGRRRSVRTQQAKRRSTSRVPHEVKEKAQEHEHKQAGGSAEQRHEKAAGAARAERAGGKGRGRRRAVRQAAPKKAVAENPKVAKTAPGRSTQEDGSPERSGAGQQATTGETMVLRRGKKRAVRKKGTSASAKAPKAQDNAAQKQAAGSGAPQENARAKSGRGRRRVARRSTS